MSKIYSEDELNNMSKEDLIGMFIDIQNRHEVLIERMATMNVKTYGRKSEKLPNPDQLSLFNEMEAVEDGTKYDDGENSESEEAEEETEQITYTRKKSKGKRKIDLDKFPAVPVNHELSREELVEVFGEDGWKRLPDQVYRKLQTEPAKFWVEEHHVAVYAAKNDDKIVKAAHSEELLNNSVASASVVASIMNAKYTNGMPLYRIEQEFERNDVPITRQNMANWVIKTSERYLGLVTDRMLETLCEEHVVQADETPCFVTKDDRPAGSKSEMWVYRSGELSGHKPIIIFKYAKGRSADHPMEVLKNFKGYLVCDGFSAYRRLDKEDDDITVCNCWVHMRRPFSDAVKAYGVNAKGVEKTLAYKALTKIGKIFSLEEKYKDLPSEERLKRRQTAIKPRVDEFFAWAKAHADDTGRQDKTAAGFRYAIKYEPQLRMFLEDGDIPIDNSATERSIRPFTVSRKTWKLIDTPSGADASATIYSIVETAKANNLKIYDYLKYLLEELPKHMNETDRTFVDDLLPWSDKLPANLKKPTK